MLRMKQLYHTDIVKQAKVLAKEKKIKIRDNGTCGFEISNISELLTFKRKSKYRVNTSCNTVCDPNNKAFMHSSESC